MDKKTARGLDELKKDEDRGRGYGDETDGNTGGVDGDGRHRGYCMFRTVDRSHRERKREDDEGDEDEDGG